MPTLAVIRTRTRGLRLSLPRRDHHTSNEDVSLSDALHHFHCSLAVSNSSSTASSLNSTGCGPYAGGNGSTRGHHGRTSDPWLMPGSGCSGSDTDHRRRSSTMTARFSLLDALDLDYALRAAAARGSVGPCRCATSIS